MTEVKSVFDLMVDMIGCGVAKNLIDNKDVEIPPHISRHMGVERIGVGVIVNSDHPAFYRSRMTSTEKPKDTFDMIGEIGRGIIVREEVSHAQFIKDMMYMEDVHLKAFHSQYFSMGIGTTGLSSLFSKSERLTPKEIKEKYRKGLKNLHGKKKHYE